MRLILLVIIMVIAVLASVVTIRLTDNKQAQQLAVLQQQQEQIQNQQQQKQQVQTVDVIVAREPIAVGSVIEEKMIDRQPWPSHLVLEGFITAESQKGGGDKPAPKVVGMVARSEFQAREPLLLSKLADPNDPSFLAAALPEGKRAVTIAVDAISGVAGFVFAGDRVDVILTHNLPNEFEMQRNGSMANGRPTVTEVLVQNIKVIGVNLRGSQPNREAVQSPSSVSLEATEEEAQKLRLSEKIGTLSLALRSLKDLKQTTIPAPTIINQISRAVMPANNAPGSSVTIVRGPGGESEQKFEGRKNEGQMPPGLGGVPMPSRGAPGQM